MCFLPKVFYGFFFFKRKSSFQRSEIFLSEIECASFRKCQIASKAFHVIFSGTGLPSIPVFILSPISEDCGPPCLRK